MGAALRVGVIGTGSLGRHHVRIAGELPEVELVGIHDLRPAVAEALAAEHGTRSFTSLETLAAEVDAVILAVPTVAHAEIGCTLLERGLHLLVEKPMASSLKEADALLAAKQKNRILSVGHVEFHNPAVQALLDAGGASRFVEVQRLSPFTPRSLDVDVILDLMIHDLQILHALDPSPIHEIRASGVEVLSPKIDMCNARISLESGLVANLTASRVSSEPVRRLRVFKNNLYFSVGYREQEIKGFGLSLDGNQPSIQPLDLVAEPREPLKAEQEAFYAACLGRQAPLVDGVEGRRALETALAVREAVEGA